MPNWMKMWTALGIFLLILALFAVLTVPWFIMGEHNRAKVERLTTVCVQHGFKGWTDKMTGQSSGCFN